MFFFLSKSLDLAVSPLVWVLLLVLAALVMFVRRTPHRGRVVGCLVGAITILLLCANPTISDRLWATLEEDAPMTYDAQQTYDVVVLLGGVLRWGITDPERPSYNDNVERLLVTYDLLRSNRAKSVIISGGSRLGNERYRSEASALGIQLEKWGIAKERIFVDDVAANTRQNAVESTRIIREHGFRKVLVVTSAFHMQRALGCFRAVDLEVDALAVDYRGVPPSLVPTELAPRTSALDRTGDALRELLGRRVYAALGYTK